MIAEIGHFALVLALVVALAQASLPLYGAARANAPLVAVARPAAQMQFVLVLAAFLALVHAFVTSDFSVYAAAINSHSTMPLVYKIAGVWGNHEGSMVLWVLILALFGAAVATFGANLPPTLQARVLAVQAMISFGFLAFILFTSDPFARVFPPPPDGQGLNPILQDPGLASHPPVLYLGYVGFSMAFSFAIAALIEGRVDASWARWVRPWTLAAWCTLTLGIAMGSWWAYYTLGWGGFWFWDPVENASFMPWLAGTALLHSAIVVEKRDALKSWTVLLAIVTFSLSLIGTFLVRSGVLTSVHAFANSPARGIFILALLVIAIGGSLILYAVRAPNLAPGGLFAPISREGALMLNNLILASAAATVLVGTLYPLFLERIGGPKISVGAPFFNLTFVPLISPLLVAVPIGPLLGWKRADLAAALQRLWVAGAAAFLAGLVALYLHSGGPILAVFGLALAAWLFVGAFAELAARTNLGRAALGETLRRARHLPRSTYGAALAHAGLGIALAGIVGTTAWRVERIATMHPGEKVALAGYEVSLDDVAPANGSNYEGQRADMTVTRDGRLVARLTPQKRTFALSGADTAVTAIHTTGIADIYAALGDSDGQGGWTVRLYDNPLAPWIWLGAVVMAAGGILSLSDRRLRVGAPARRRLPESAATASGD
ncbi:MAG TPA: heme lyase CcmF/NrfE family subunit [Alphaproteobacteria bacterium]|nr:heme lyase CcmF/NrfE family subunit [Alphaproteobacteria bacterium]